MTAKQKKRPVRKMRAMMGLLALMAFLILIGGILAGCSAAASAPDVTKLEWNSSTIIYDRDGKELYRLHAGENRTPVKLNDIPEHVIDAFIAIEDPSFYDHFGVNVRGVARAVWRSTLHVLKLPGGRLEGGSTITQQLARDAWLSQEITMKRKLQEMVVAIDLERNYTKNEILEMYLNQIYYGRGAYGIEAAANTFFGKDAGELNLAEGAQLAGMVNGPSYFDPYADMEASIKRRNLVLQAMLKEEKITQEVYEAARAFEPTLRTKKREAGLEAGHFVDYVISILHDAKPGLADQYGLNLGQIDNVAKAGLKVYTTLDSRLQGLAEQAVTDQMLQADKDYRLTDQAVRPEAAMVAMSPKTGEVLAMVGGRDHSAMLEFNLATDAYRQPGSAIKPLVAYAPALEAGLSPATILDDAPVMLTQDGRTVWPQNYDFKYLGLKPMRFGVEQSQNPMAIRAMQAAGGPAKAADFGRKLGLSIGKDDEHLALALGGLHKGTTVMEMTAAYGALANLGTKVEPIVISRIENSSGHVIFEAHPQERQVMKSSTAFMMVDMMKDVIRKGTAYGFTGGFKGWPAAGKTGTTEHNRDAWFVGFTPDLVVSVWNGYEEDSKNLPWTGAFVPVRTWNQFMTQAVTQKPADWARPSAVVSAPVCRPTGFLPNEACPKDQIGTELFARGTEPKTAGDLLVKAKAVEVTVAAPDGKSAYKEWQLWQNGCIGTPVERTFIKRTTKLVLHPTDPQNPKYLPADLKDELPTKTCQPASLWDRLFPPKLPAVPGEQEPPVDGKKPGTSKPGKKD